MPFRREGSAVWYAKYRDGRGRTVRRSTGTTERAKAEIVEARWRQQAWDESVLGESPRRQWKELALEFLKSGRAEERAEYAIPILREHFGELVLQELTPADVTAYRRKREKAGRAPATIIRELGVFSRTLNYARRELGWRGIPDVTRGVAPKKPPGRIRWLTWEEYEKLVAAAEANKRAPWLADFIRLAVNTGMRKGELLGLEWRRVDLHRGMVYLEPEHNKARRMDSVSLNGEALAALKRLQRDGATHVFERKNGRRIQNVKRSFAAAVADAKIAPCRIHDLRHTCAAWLVQGGVPLRTVAEALRHKDISMTMRYSHLSPDNVRDAMDALTVYQNESRARRERSESGGNRRDGTQERAVND